MDEDTKQHLQDAIDAGDLNAIRAIMNGPVKYIDGDVPAEMRGANARLDAQPALPG